MVDFIREDRITKVLHQVAEEYRAKGYVVKTHVPAYQLPDLDLKSEELVDIFAQSRIETVIVEIFSRQNPGNIHRLVDVTEAVQNRPGWRYELIVLADPNAPKYTEFDLPIMTREEAAQKIAQAEKLLQQGQAAKAFKLAWHAALGIMRVIMAERDDDINLQRPFSLGAAVATTVSLGYIDQPDGLNYYVEAMKIHEDLLQGTLTSDFDLATYTKNFIERVRDLLHESTLND